MEQVSSPSDGVLKPPHVPEAEKLKGEIVSQSSLFQRKERLKLSIPSLADSTIYSIRIQSLPKEQQLDRPTASRRGWVALGFDQHQEGSQEVQKVYVWANVNSIAKHTGLSTKVIGNMARRGTLEAFLKTRFQETAGIESAITQASTVPLPALETGRPQVNIRLADGSTRQASRAALARAFGISEAAIQEASMKRRLELLPGDQVRLKPPPKALKDMVLKAQRLRDEIRPPGTDNPPPALAGRVSRLGHKPFQAFVSKEGAIYIANMSKKLGAGSFKDVTAGIGERGETVAIGLTRRGGTPEDYRELSWNHQFQRVRGMAQFHVGFALKQSLFGRLFESPQVVTIAHRYKNDLFHTFPRIHEQPLAQRLWNRAFICDQLLAGLASAHKDGILLRDVKLENVLISSDDQGTLTDVVHSDFAFAIAESERSTAGTAGSLDYFAPERRTRGLQGGGFSAAAQVDDRWALGTALFMALTGREAPWRLDHRLTVKDCQREFERAWPALDSDSGPMQELRQLCRDMLFEKKMTTQQLADRAKKIFESVPKPV